MLSSRSTRWIKYGALILMVAQNSAFVLVMRFSRKQQDVSNAAHGATYNISMVVTLQELFKLILCFSVLAIQHRSIRAAFSPLRRPKELVRISVPAACFTLQNNVLYIALSNLDPLLFQITYQVKTLLTALLSVRMLGRSFGRFQWLSQVLLTIGIVLVQLNDQPKDAVPGSQRRSPLLGMGAVLSAAFSSSFASVRARHMPSTTFHARVYFEKILKGRTRDGPVVQAPSSLWFTNVQLCAWTVPMNSVLAMLQSDGSAALTDPLRGFERSTWAVIVVNGFGGLLVAVVIKYADNILKGFATAGAIILTGVLAPTLSLGPPPNALLATGTICVIGALGLYSTAAPAAKPRAIIAEPAMNSRGKDYE